MARFTLKLPKNLLISILLRLKKREITAKTLLSGVVFANIRSNLAFSIKNNLKCAEYSEIRAHGAKGSFKKYVTPILRKNTSMHGNVTPRNN